MVWMVLEVRVCRHCEAEGVDLHRQLFGVRLRDCWGGGRSG